MIGKKTGLLIVGSGLALIQLYGGYVLHKMLLATVAVLITAGIVYMRWREIK